MKYNKFFRKMSFIICIMLLFFNSQIFSIAKEFDVNAKSAILIDADSGKIIFEKNSHEKLPPASVTKIMTMLLAMEALETKKISLQDKVVISERAASMGGSQLYLEPGEEKTVEQLLKGIAVASANDACVALGEYIAGSEELFVKKMNEKAKELGMKDTQFKNTNGLPEEGHYTSAYDIAVMSRELLKYPQIHKWLTIWMSTMKVGKRKQSTLELTNTNRLIRTYSGANGIKTGFTQEARYCLSASATRNNLTLIAVILGAPTSKIRFQEAKKLLDYGFANYNSVLIAKKGEIIDKVCVEKGKVDKINVIAKEGLKVLVKKGEEDSVKKEVILPKMIKASIQKNEKVGEIIVYDSNGKEIGKVDLVAQRAVDKASMLNMLGKILKNVPK
ncbi:D-alanyl-D-alanine carboxypeptidase (penicillin-binding protein 5/6) [Caminicella sporogenes DSM 14501]|uniref:serine-type D-Ala-D-Ala carboxypeptidase n=1 Tax=Caminicella sporogenes DSM 14501 TaxID=1121266 RepID=A0A1M6LK11_9FIRM|nr:D-alanyl-D-alanine carboxypeptidase family protein [Caminicella sporogenes]RKD27857.1 D-alanyl-D-alanine carboxypeptidase [Caminicella sporogenes]SHJ71520.1 D-alanyl-D-alanine carboxypeptidase (penicillin-binding protein 5/6) [Caminicella sporogenes DSM 14501]